MKSFEELCKENYGRIFKYIFSITKNKEATEDLIQEVFTIAYEKGRIFLNHEKPAGFLYKTARNITLTYIKGLKRQETLAKEYLYGNATKEGEPYQKLLREQDQKIDETRYTGQVIESLNPKEYHLYKQRYVEGKSIKEIASEKGISEAAVRMRLVRLRREVQNIVKKLKFDEK